MNPYYQQQAPPKPKKKKKKKKKAPLVRQDTPSVNFSDGASRHEADFDDLLRSSNMMGIAEF